MDNGNHSGLHNLTQLSQRGGVDMRPTLLRVLTDLYVQKFTHTPEEERHYTELALRLLDSVDAATRTAVAGRLARHLAPPILVIQRLARDLPGVAAPLREHPLLLRAEAEAEAKTARTTAPNTADKATDRPGTLIAASPKPVAPAGSEVPQRAVAEAGDVLPTRAAESVAAQRPQDRDAPPLQQPIAAADLNAPIGTALASELNEMFFAANAEERRLILLNLHIAAPLPSGDAFARPIERDPGVAQRLEQAALARNRDEFANELARALAIPLAQAQRIAGDDLGEPIVAAAKALAMPRDMLYRVLLFVNTAVGHSVERVHALAALYDDLTEETAAHMAAIWQAMQKSERQEERKPARYQPLLWNDEARAGARSASVTVRRAPSTQRQTRRGAS